jgi:hypothetical protein
MPLFTRAGPTADADFPGKRRNLFDRMWRWSGFLAFANLVRAPFGFLIYSKMREAEAREKAPEPEKPWHGLPEAELTDEQEREAQRRVANGWQKRQ